MDKYTIEGEVNFYEELSKSLKSNNDLISDKCCLITNDPLTDKYVKLNCGHCFNYKPLWNEIYNQKFSSSVYKDFNKLLKLKDKIECPYCRNKDSPLLPFYPDLDFKLAYGITTSDEQYKLELHNNKLVYTNTLHYYTGSCNYVYDDGTECNGCYVIIHEGLNKTFCNKHFNIVKHKFIKDEKMKLKLELKEKKMKEKLELKEQKKKEKKLKINLSKDENIILGPNVIIKEDLNVSSDININLNMDLCIYIFKKGLNKNKQCSCKISNSNLCKKHYINNKNNNTNN